MPVLKGIFPSFDSITKLKHRNEELAEIVGMSVDLLSSKTDVDIPYSIMDKLRKYLPYTSEFEQNRLTEKDLETDKHSL
jgi:hypothetical protein